jgi:hypothetical protein
MSSITGSIKMMQEEPLQKQEILIANEATTNEPQERNERPNKYKYDEFAGYSGERYLDTILQKVLPYALWRTWHYAVEFQAPHLPCYVGTARLAERVKPQQRKIEMDFQEFRERGLLRTYADRLPQVQPNGTIRYQAVTIKDWTSLYDLAHEYHLWTISPSYIPPEREYVDLLVAEPGLLQKLLRFDNYRRIIMNKKPGRKPQPTVYQCKLTAEPAIATTETATTAPRTEVQNPKYYLNEIANTSSPYRLLNTDDISIDEESSSFSTSQKKEQEPSPKTIGKPKTGRESEQVNEEQSNSKPNPPVSPRNNDGAAAAKRAGEALGYTEAEIKHDSKKRGAAAAGIPAEHYQKLQGGLDRAEQQEEKLRRQFREEEDQEGEHRQPSRPERERPAQMTKEIEQYARQYDDPEKIQGDVTRAIKIFFAAQQALDYFDFTLFWTCYDTARKAAAKYAKEHRNRLGRVNRVPYMFTCWENAFNFSLEELVYLRTEHPLYADYSLGDMIDYLRATYQEQYNSDQTRLDYREWLQILLDRLEHRKEPKDRSNRTMRDY